MIKSGFLKLFMILAIVSLAGCSTASNSDSEMKKISIMLDWYPNAVHSFIYTALAKGYFADQGLDVEIKMPADTNDPLKLVAAGEVDLALSYQPQVIMARAEDIPVQSLAAIVRHPLNYLMVPDESDIKSPKDLVGKRVGYPSIPLNEALVKTMVRTDGGDAAQVNMTDIGWDIIPAIATDKVEAIVGGYINHERVLLEKEGHAMRVFDPSKFGVPDYYELVLVAGDKGVKDNLETYKKFWKALSQGQKFVVEHPDQGLNFLFEHENKDFPLDREVEKKSIDILLPLMDGEDKPFGYQEQASWNAVVKWLYDEELIRKPVKAEDAYMNLMKF